MYHTTGMNTDTQSQRALTLARQSGLIRARDLADGGIPRTVLTRLVARGELERVTRGLYSVTGAPDGANDSLVTISRKVPKSVFCLLTALQFHELTTQLPRQAWIAMPRGSHTPRMDYPPLKMVQLAPESFDAGIELHQRGGSQIRVYSAAKTVADCFKHRNLVGLDVAIEALREGWTQRKVSADDLWAFATVNRVANVIRPYMEAIV
jgi:predicted transcriptional regulator of viral defense system